MTGTLAHGVTDLNFFLSEVFKRQQAAASSHTKAELGPGAIIYRSPGLLAGVLIRLCTKRL